jgi:cytochrome c553
MVLIWGVVFASAWAGSPPVVSEMHERFTTLSSARDAVVRGDLERAKSEAAWLTDLGSVTHVPKPWRPYLANLNEASQLLSGATDLQGASRGVANAALACAECHAASGGGPSLANQDQVPPQAWVAGQNMPLHKWAVDWMWVGLLTNSDEAWLRGAKELDDMPLVPKFEAAPPGGLRELEQLVYVLAGKATTTTDPTERAELMGNLIATCSQCHAKARPLAQEPKPAEAP